MPARNRGRQPTLLRHLRDPRATRWLMRCNSLQPITAGRSAAKHCSPACRSLTANCPRRCLNAPQQRPASRPKPSGAGSPRSLLWCSRPSCRCVTDRHGSCWRSISTPKPRPSSIPACRIRRNCVPSRSSLTNILATHSLSVRPRRPMHGRLRPAICRARTGSGPSCGVSGRTTATLRPRH